MQNIPTLEELLKEEARKFSSPLTTEGLQLLVINVANQHARNHVKAALKAAAKKGRVKVSEEFDLEDIERAKRHSDYFEIDEKSILTAYPLENIK